MKFNRCLRNIIPDFEDKLKNKFEESELQKLLNTQLIKIKGKPFYDIMILLTSDFDLITENIFASIIKEEKKAYLIKKSALKSVQKQRNNYQKFINQFITLQSDIAERAYIDDSRLSKVLSLKNQDFYAWEVVSIANSQNYSGLKAFEELYKD